MNIRSFCLILAFIFFGCISNIKPQSPPPSDKMDMKQTLSDGAQKMTIAFNGLAFLSGNFCSCTFIPPGKVSDYFGFQFLRDNDPTNMGHNTDFLTRIANNMLYVLTENQKAQLIAVAKAQVAQINEYGYKRLPMIYAFNRLLNKDLPQGSTGLDKKAVMDYSAELYRLDGRISLVRGSLFGSIIKALNAKQKHYLDSIGSMGMLLWPDLPEQIDKKPLNNNEFVAVMTYASEMFAWYKGNEESDVYFCPERQGDYFGSFYLKDAPAVGNPNYSIDTNLTQNGGKYFLDALTSLQAKLITNLVDTQKTSLLDIVAKRTSVSKLLRGYWLNDNIDSTTVLSLSEEYGRLDGEISYYYATNFAKVGWSLTNVQKDTLKKIRNLDDFPCNGVYLYSDNISLPDMINTDFFFNTVSSSNELSDKGNQLSAKIYPNPFSGNAQISITLPVKNDLSVCIYDNLGRLVNSFVYEKLDAGTHVISLDAADSDVNLLNAGIYYCVIQTAGSSVTAKLINIK